MFSAKWVIYTYVKLPFDYDGLCSVIDQHAFLKASVHGYTSDELSYSYQPHQHSGSAHIDTNHERKYVKVVQLTINFLEEYRSMS